MAHNPLHGQIQEHGHLLRHQTLPPATCSMLVMPRRVRVTARAYNGAMVTVEADLIARSQEWVCLAQPDGTGVWNVWLHREACTPL